MGVAVLTFRATRAAMAIVAAGCESEANRHLRSVVELHTHRKAIETDATGEEARAWLDRKRGRGITRRVQAAGTAKGLYGELSADAHGDPAGIYRRLMLVDGEARAVNWGPLEGSSPDCSCTSSRSTACCGEGPRGLGRRRGAPFSAAAEGSRREGHGAQAAGLRTRGGIGARGRSVYRSARDDEEFLVDGDRDQRVAVAATSGSSSAKREGAGSEATSCSQALGDQLLSPLAGSRYCSSSPRTPARVWGRSSIPHPSASA